MSTIYKGYLDVAGVLTATGYIDAVEQYNGGWSVNVSLSLFNLSGEEQTLPATLGQVLSAGIAPGSLAKARLQVSDTEIEGSEQGVRTWTGFVIEVAPYPSGIISSAFCKVSIIDPVSYLGSKRIWGAFRGHSAAEMVGGAISLAAGTEGQATLNPVVRNHPRITIHNALRSNLDFIPYAIASGQSLSGWLNEFFGLLSIRMEMLATEDGELTINLIDSAPRDTPLEMELFKSDVGAANVQAANGQLAISDLGAYRGANRRGILVDDPDMGNFRRIGGGPVGTLIAGTDIDLDEAARRAEFELLGRGAELLQVNAKTKQPAIRPGRTIRLTESVLNRSEWQVFYAKHSVRGTTYKNHIGLMDARFPWYPRRQRQKPGAIIPAIVDSGPAYRPNDPVPRDSLGRIYIRFPFLPTLQVEDVMVRSFDSSMDTRITKDDFSHLIGQRFDSDGNPVQGDDYDEAETRRQWQEMDADEMRERMEAASEDSGLTEEQRAEAAQLAHTEAREADVAALNAGNYDDPYPGREDSDLSRTELMIREGRLASKVKTYRYLAWKRALAFEEAEGDYDHDGYITAIDSQMSDELREAFADPDQRRQLEQAARARQEELDQQELAEQQLAEFLAEQEGEGEDNPDPEGDGDSPDPAGDGDNPDPAGDGDSPAGDGDGLEDIEDIPDTRGDEEIPEPTQQELLVAEYLRLFGEDSTSPAAQLAQRQRDVVSEQWPARLPLRVVQPMAGGLHGFVTAHRQGDACRVLVHNVMHAEVIGFQYRSDRELNKEINGATAGIVVEHNLQSSWSGMVFRRTEADETAADETEAEQAAE